MEAQKRESHGYEVLCYTILISAPILLRFKLREKKRARGTRHSYTEGFQLAATPPSLLSLSRLLVPPAEDRNASACRLVEQSSIASRGGGCECEKIRRKQRGFYAFEAKPCAVKSISQLAQLAGTHSPLCHVLRPGHCSERSFWYEAR